MPQPHIVSSSVRPRTGADFEKVSIALSKLTQNDPSFTIHTDPITGQSTIAAPGLLQLETLLERMVREYNVEADVSKPQVSYRETIRGNSEAETRYIRQAGGVGNYGHVKLRVSPNERGKGYEFTDDIRGGVVPGEYIRPVDESIQEAMQGGVLAGYEMVDIKVSLCDGSFHDVDSNELAFRIAGSMAFKEAARKANPALLEPVMSVEVSLPAEDVARISNDLNARRGRIESMAKAGSLLVIQAAVPLASMFTYADALSRSSQGRARFAMEFKQFEICGDGRDFNEQGPFALPAIPRRPQPGGSPRRAMHLEE